MPVRAPLDSSGDSTSGTLSADAGMAISSGADFAASDHSPTMTFYADNSEYRVWQLHLPTGVAVLNSVVLHEDISARPYL